MAERGLRVRLAQSLPIPLAVDFRCYPDEMLALVQDSDQKTLAVWAIDCAERVMPYFGQELFLMAEPKGPLTDEGYRRALETNHRLARDEGLTSNA